MTPEIIGTITLKTPHTFTQYSEHAAWTDYVSCKPQTVPLKYDGYWLFASFEGVLQATTFPPGSREVGSPAKALTQQSHCGFSGNHHLFTFQIDKGEVFESGSHYNEGCTPALVGKPITHYRRQPCSA